MEWNQWQCFLCFSEFSELERGIEHLRLEHCVIQKVNTIKCIAKNVSCKKTFQTWSGLRKHVVKCRASHNIGESDEYDDSRANNVTHILIGENDVKNFDIQCDNIPIIYKNCPESDVDNNDLTSDVEEEAPNFHSRMVESVQCCADKIEQLQVAQNVKNTFHTLMKTLLVEIYAFYHNSIKNNVKPDLDKYVFEVLEVAHDDVLNELRKFDTKHKRNKLCEKNPLFVKPQEMAIGTHWETQRKFDLELIVPNHKQSSFQYVPITKTLQSLFSRHEFRQSYFDYNNVISGNKHKCVDGIFEDFCCGHVYRNNKLFQNYPESLQIQLFTDGFEMCDALKSKANLHSQVAFYFAIRNLPSEHAFNTKNIHLVALCNADHLKSEQTDYNNIWKILVDDLAELENIGIEVADGFKLKGMATLYQLTY